MHYYTTGDGRGRMVRIHDGGVVETYAPGSTVEGRKGRWRPENLAFEDYGSDVLFNRDGEWLAVETPADVKRIQKAQDAHRSYRDQFRLDKANGAA